MTDFKDKSSSPTRMYNLSPDKYGKSAFKDLSYTPEKLYQNFMYKQVTVTKKIEQEKKRIRELQSENTLYLQKIRKYEIENETVKKSLNLQIDMYKKMLKDQQEDKARHIKNIQQTYSLQIQRIIQNHEEQIKVGQAQKQELQRQIEDLLQRIKQLQKNLSQGDQYTTDLTNRLTITSQNLANTQQKLEKAEQLARISNQRSANQINSLNQRIQKQRDNFRSQKDSIINQKNKEMDALKRLHQTELQKLDNKRSAQLATKNLQLKQIKNTFQVQGRRMQEIISHKDRNNTSLNNDLNKQKQRVLALTKHYENELNQLLHNKQSLLQQVQKLQNERRVLQLESQQLKNIISNQRNDSDHLIQGLKSNLQQRNIDLLRQNQHLIRTVQKYQHQLAYLRQQNRLIHHEKQIDTNKFRISVEHVGQQNKSLAIQVKNLRDVLLESSLQMEKCKQEFIRMQHEKQRLVRISRQCEQEATHYKILLNEKQLEIRQWRQSYYNLKSRY